MPPLLFSEGLPLLTLHPILGPVPNYYRQWNHLLVQDTVKLVNFARPQSGQFLFFFSLSTTSGFKRVEDGAYTLADRCNISSTHSTNNNNINNDNKYYNAYSICWKLVFIILLYYNYFNSSRGKWWYIASASDNDYHLGPFYYTSYYYYCWKHHGSEKAYDGPNTTLQASYFWTSNYELKPTYREYCTWFIFDLPRKPPAAAMKSSLSVYCYEN